MNFETYLRSNLKDKNNTSQIVTHTRIASPALNIYGGAYSILPEKKDEFYSNYYKLAYLNDKTEYLTEKQIADNTTSLSGKIINGPILVDLDFRYDTEIKGRQHTDDQLSDMVFDYVDELKKYFMFNKNETFNVFVLEKPNVNCLEDKTKDGIHMVIGIQADHIIQRMIRTTMLEILPKNIFGNLPLKNDWDTVLDEGITNGHTNWQLYGSCKPGNECYELRHHYKVSYDENDGHFCVEKQTTQTLSGKVSKDIFIQLTAQYEDNPVFPMNPKIKSAYDRIASQVNSKNSKRSTTPTKKRIIVDEIVENEGDDVFTSFENISIHSIHNQEQLDCAIEKMMNTFRQSQINYDLPELHEYTQILPDIFYKSGSHELNRKVAFALKHADERLFLSWIKLRSKALDFDYSSIAKLYGDWKRYFNQSSSLESQKITKKSIIYWAKQYAFDEYTRIKKNAITSYIDITLKYKNAHPEYDIANVLYQLYKDEYIYIIDGKTREWYRFINHRWILDPNGTSLRKRISTELFDLYSTKQDQLINEKTMLKMSEIDATTDINETVDIVEIEKQNKDKDNYIKTKLESITHLLIKLKSTANKNNIMAEASSLFLDQEFIDKSNENKWLLGFTNGVYDFKEKRFRDGQPEDYITLSTNSPYMKLNVDKNEEHRKITNEIKNMIKCIYPEPSLCDYMWEHWASILIGVNYNQTITFYLGNGSNGKSKITDLLKLALGNYCEKCTIQLITSQRGKMGSASPEVAQLKGKRLVYMSESNKGEVLNDGVTKELTGDAEIGARGLFENLHTFSIQCTLIACMNNLLEVRGNDDGIWRRIRVALHESKFTDADKIEQYKTANKYVFEKDLSLDAKMTTYAPYFMSMLIDIVNRTDGKVKDCDMVLSASNEYRKNQDFLCAFLSDTIEKTGLKSDQIRKNEIWNEFKRWYSNEHGNSKGTPIKSNELYELVDKQYGTKKNNIWYGIKIKYDEIEQEDDEHTEHTEHTEQL